MNLILLLRVFLVLASFLVLIVGQVEAGSKNILVIVADDFGIDSLALYNKHPSASLPPTPNIDSLAARGVRFENVYAYPVCSPSRATMITGRYAFRTGVNDVIDTVNQQGLYTNEVTLPELLSPTHHTASFGKWHLGGGASAPNLVGGWSHFAGSLAGGLGANATNFWLWTKTINGVSRANHLGYATTDNVNDALEWLGNQNTNRWFLWLAFNAPHTPFHLPPAHLRSHYTTLSGTASDIQQSPRRYYEAAIEAMDTELGRLLTAINFQETTVIFSGDNGTVQRVIQPPYNIAGRAKDTLYEGGIRVPFIIAGANITNPGRVSQAILHVVDTFATVLELAGLNPVQVLPRSMPNDSRSLVPILHDKPFAPTELAVLIEDVSAQPTGSFTGRAARLGSHKLFRWNNGDEEFYDLISDPLESTNLLTSEMAEHQRAILDQLRAKLGAWVNQPKIVAQFSSREGFAIDAGWYVNASFSLWRNSVITDAGWIQVSNTGVERLGEVIRLTDPTPPLDQAFYRLIQE